MALCRSPCIVGALVLGLVCSDTLGVGEEGGTDFMTLADFCSLFNVKCNGTCTSGPFYELKEECST